MAIVPNERPLGNLKLVNNESENIKTLNQDGAFRWIHGKLKMNLTNNAGIPVFREDSFLRYIKGIIIRRNSKFAKYDLPLDMMNIIAEHNTGKPLTKTEPSDTANATYDVECDFTIHFAERIFDDSDVSALLQTKNLTNLEVVVDTGNENDIAETNPPTINSASIEFDCRDYTGDIDGKNINDDTEIKLTDIIETVDVYSIENNKTQYSNPQTIDLPAGASVLEQIIVVKDDGTRSNELVKEFKVRRVRNPRGDFLEKDWKMANSKSKEDFGLDNPITGVFKYDWTEKLASKFGLITGSKSTEVYQMLTSNTVDKTKDTIEIYTKEV